MISFDGGQALFVPHAPMLARSTSGSRSLAQVRRDLRPYSSATSPAGRDVRESSEPLKCRAALPQDASFASVAHLAPAARILAGRHNPASLFRLAKPTGNPRPSGDFRRAPPDTSLPPATVVSASCNSPSLAQQQDASSRPARRGESFGNLLSSPSSAPTVPCASARKIIGPQSRPHGGS